ncbi:peptidoglycan DD-metalloendopeptidase family protein [Flavobacterium selenitireducens]|uniref:peptidoglycan DD-metalloendopeptidase family protein n=1 Tax=Flavobacterium selenitireducens TaxID=2722704 RepID=UPI00168A82CA|nr:peptidoglycan DD-metalloendopeptidase family protein [Flavobacterium selenitireducens]MBD3583017.1 peptidoglycan DD-metalloendopeptidase family protein [Flavobacterium selenitireducens]
MDLHDFLLKQQDVHVLDATIRYDRFRSIDLSSDNPDVTVELVSDSDGFSAYIDQFIDDRNGLAAFGGYLEKRTLYKRSELFQDETEQERDIHIGLDIWAEAETPVLAALEGKVHSFDFNAGKGNYGPTIILEHEFDGVSFFTLYGHLSAESIETIEIGDDVGKGQQIGTLGEASVNGDYPPHLHFQIVIDLEGNFGDYPGVCSQDDLEHYRNNCPDPNILLKIKHTT